MSPSNCTSDRIARRSAPRALADSREPRLARPLRRLLGSFATCLVMASVGISQAQTNPVPDAGSTTSATRSEAPVEVFNRTIAVFRVPFLGVSAEDRARRTKAVVNELLAKDGPGEVTVEKAPQGNLLMIDGQLALILTPEDANLLRNESLEATTKAAVAKLEQVIDATRELRDRSRLLRSAGIAGLATVIFIAIVWLTWRLRDWFERRLTTALRRHTAAVHVAGTRLLQAERVAAIARWLVHALSWLLLLVLAHQWLSRVFEQFPYTRPWSEQLDGFLFEIARQIGGGIVRALPDLLVAVVIFLLARGTIGLLDPFFSHIEAGRGRLGWLDADTARPTRRIFSVALWLFAIVMAYPYLPGSQSEAFKGMSVLVGLMITVGGSSLLGQAASGLILMYSRSVRLGEYVRINDQEGTITHLGTFTTTMRTGLGEELTLPNALVLNTVTKNYSRAVQGKGFILDTTLTIGYDTPWRQIEAMLVEAARRTPGVLAQPAPRVFQTALTDFYPEYRLVCQAIPSEARPRAELLANLHANIQDVFNEHGVQIMSPHYLGDPATPKVVAKEDWYAAPAASRDESAPSGARRSA